MQKKKSGFTLVEMLIVVVIIGILSAALLPRLTGHMARTRDLKRQTDLRNIAAAVEMYKNKHGKLPLMGDAEGVFERLDYRFFGAAGHLQYVLKEYLSDVPANPNKSAIPEHVIMQASNGGHRDIFRRTSIYKGNPYRYFQPGQYLYQTICKTRWCKAPEGALLITQVETPEAANFLALDYHKSTTTFCTADNNGRRLGILGGPWWAVEHNSAEGRKSYPVTLPDDCLKLCTSVSYGEEAKMDATTVPGEVNCVYNNKEQLYYIVKIE